MVVCVDIKNGTKVCVEFKCVWIGDNSGELRGFPLPCPPRSSVASYFSLTVVRRNGEIEKSHWFKQLVQTATDTHYACRTANKAQATTVMAEREGSAILDAEDCRTLGLSSSPSASAADTSVAGPTNEEEVNAAASLHLQAELPGPTVSSRKKKKRKVNRAGAATAAKKKCKATSERDRPTGVKKLKSGKLESSIWWGGKKCYIGTFDTAEQASAAYMSVRKDLDDAKLSRVGADEVDDIFDAAQKKAVEAVGGVVPKKKKSERDLPQGVTKVSTGTFATQTYWGGKGRAIGTFATPELASAAYMSVKKDLDDAKLSAVDADEVAAIFDAAKTKAIEVFGGITQGSKRKGTGFIDLTGVPPQPFILKNQLEPTLYKDNSRRRPTKEGSSKYTGIYYCMIKHNQDGRRRSWSRARSGPLDIMTTRKTPLPTMPARLISTRKRRCIPTFTAG